MQNKNLRRIKGEVEKTSPYGIMIENEWYNYSKYDEVPAPLVGDEVAIQVNAKGYVKTLEILENSAQQAHEKPVNRQEIITRLALLNTATVILTSHGKPYTAQQTIALAAYMEEYAFHGNVPPQRHSSVSEVKNQGGVDPQSAPTNPKNVGGHSFHGHHEADQRVADLHIWGKKNGYDNSSMLREVFSALFERDIGPCLHKFVMMPDNWGRVLEIIRKESVDELYGK